VTPPLWITLTECNIVMLINLLFCSLSRVRLGEIKLLVKKARMRTNGGQAPIDKFIDCYRSEKMIGRKRTLLDQRD